MSDQPISTESGDDRPGNRLQHETSPYLLQHARNPVDWYPWGPEAFEAARKRDVPILLSVGYSTCYWCHVMERESFENEQVAAVMNENLVCIKLDREERPDVDDIYMNALQLMSQGRGGWPLNVFLDPNTLKPFYGGTYFRAPQFTELVPRINEYWKNQRADALARSDAVANAVIQQIGAARAPAALGQAQVTGSVETLLRIHDRADGGFGKAPKFPQPSYLEFLLQFRAAAGDDDTRDAVDAAVKFTLNRMAQGGMNDQVGGGFHRYSTDTRWLVPHFEKMLYDNGQLAETYAKAAATYDDAFFRRTAIRSCDYVLREMTSPEGAFLSAQDAEVNHREGQNYVWTIEELRELLDESDATFIAGVYGVDRGTNFRDPHHPDEDPVNVLFLPARPEELAARFNLAPEAFLERVDRINRTIYDARAKRDQPITDDKILAGWNGLMIAGLAVSGGRLEEPRFTAAAARAAAFILREMRDDDGGLLRTHRAGVARIPAFFEDYALFIHGLIELHRSGTDGNGDTLREAILLLEQAEQRFADGTGGYFDTLPDQEDLFVRTRTLYDGAVPSGTSVMVNNLVDLYETTGERAHLDRAVSCIRANSAYVAEMPVAAINLTRALTRILMLDDAAAAKALADAPAVAAMPDPGQTHVQVFASVEEVTVGPDAPATLTLRLKIDDGFHITAAEPGPAEAELVPLRVGIIGGSGARAFADYPEGKPFGAKGLFRVHDGMLELPIVIEREGDWAGNPTLALTYQVCTDEYCLAPTTVEIDVKLTRGGQ